MNEEYRNVKGLIDSVILDLKGNENLNNGLLSLNLHGGVPFFENEDKYLDIDIIFLYKDSVISSALHEIKMTFTSLCTRLNISNNYAFFAIKSGPMHPLRENDNTPLFDLNKKRIIFFHISLFSESDYSCKNSDTAPSSLLAYNWQHLQPIVGCPLSTFRTVEELSVDDVVNAGLGINDTIFMLKNKEKGYWIHETDKMVWGKEQFKDFDDYEMTVYALRWCINNSLCYLSQILPIKIEKNKNDVFANHFLKKTLFKDFSSVVEFKSNIKLYRQQFVENPQKFREAFDVKAITEKIVSILQSAKEKLLSIQKITNCEFNLPNLGKDVPIYYDVNLKKLLYNAINKKDYDKITLITDGNVARFFDIKPWIVEWGRPCEEIIIKDDVSDKSPNKLLETLEFLEKSGITTTSLLILFGGGSIGNMGGVAAGLIFRGIDFLHVPTTLVAQLDSSIGCKQSVNGFISKNKFGLFHVPESININILFNDTLEKEHLRSGLVEAIKHGLCQSQELANDVIAYCDKNLCLDGNIEKLENIILKTIEFKLEYMQIDPFENSPSQHLELGHKIGHAVEFLAKGKIPHGICVAFGIIAEAKYFLLQNMISPQLMQLLENYLKKIVGNIHDVCLIEDEKIIDNLFWDNKITKNKLPLVLLKRIEKPKSTTVCLDKNTKELFLQSIDYAKRVFAKYIC